LYLTVTDSFISILEHYRQELKKKEQKDEKGQNYVMNDPV